MAHSKDLDLEVGNVMDQVSIDVCGPFTTTRDGNSVLLVAVGHFSRWVEAYPLPDQTAETCARVLYEQFFCRLAVVASYIQITLLHSDWISSESYALSSV